MSHRISLSQQIDEVNREITERGRVYPRLVGAGKLRQSVADYQLERMMAVLATLKWMQNREAELREFLALPIDARTKLLQHGRLAAVAATVLPVAQAMKQEMIAAGERSRTDTCPKCAGRLEAALVGPKDHLRLACLTPGCLEIME